MGFLIPQYVSIFAVCGLKLLRSGEMENTMSRSSDILSLTGEAAVLARHGKISFANAAAVSILGEKCIGQSVQAVFGKELASVQASSFIAGLPVDGKHYIIRMTKMEDEQLLFFSCPEIAPALLNDAFLYNIRSTLMNLGISASRIRERAEGAGDTTTLANVASITHSYYKLHRLISNVSLVLDISRGTLQTGIVEQDMSALCQKVMDTVVFFCPEVDFHINLGEKIICPADTAMVTNLLLNLVSNCLIHAKGYTRISVTLAAAADSVVLAVSDDGCGVEPSRLHMVFDRYRYNFDISSMNCGIGLGLTAVRSIAQLHGGALLMESRPGQGTSVRASFHRRTSASKSLHAPQPTTQDALRLTLIGLADYLPPSCYNEKYMD